YNYDKDSNVFRSLTKLAMKKATIHKTIQQYSYLRIGQQICHSHYMSIVENFQERTYRHEDIPIPQDRSSNRLNMEEDIELDLQNRIDEINEW
ncbi:12465_t:CDS:2, partial [Gigaspora rosea]